MRSEPIPSFFKSPELVAAIRQHGRLKLFPKDSVLSRPGEDILFVPLVLRGCLRILRQNEKGDEIFLYHLYPGQTCAVSLTCCQAGKKSSVKAVAETDTEVMQIPVVCLEEWSVYPEWKAFVNEIYQNRFAELLEVIDLIAFNHMDKQLLHYLNERSRALNSQVIQITHQQIADELHTHREAISRLLRTLEEKKFLRLGRNEIEIL